MSVKPVTSLDDAAYVIGRRIFPKLGWAQNRAIEFHKRIQHLPYSQVKEFIECKQALQELRSMLEMMGFSKIERQDAPAFDHSALPADAISDKALTASELLDDKETVRQ